MVLAIALLATGLIAPPSAGPHSQPGTSQAAAGLLSLIEDERLEGSFLCRSRASLSKIEAACRAVEVEELKPALPRDLMLLDGVWKLVYSSALAGPLPLPAPMRDDLLLPALLASGPRDITQKIDVMKRRVVNEVSIAPWPTAAAAGPLAYGPIADLLSALQRASVRLELDHAFAVAGDGSDGRRRQVAAGSVVSLSLERVRRTLNGMPTSDVGVITGKE